MKTNILYLLLLINISFLKLVPNSVYDDDLLCSRTADKNKCKETILTSDVLECCKVKVITVREDTPTESNFCSAQVKPFSSSIEYFKTQIGEAVYKENMGFRYMNKMDSAKIIEAGNYYDCTSGQFNVVVNLRNFTDEEKSILQSDNHCLKHGDYYTHPSDFETCSNSSILESSEELGLTCGFYEIHVNLKNGTTIKDKICNIFDKNIYKSKKLGYYDRDSLNSLFYDHIRMAGVEADNYVAYITGIKDKTLVYYSANNSVIYDEPTNNSKFLNFRNLILFWLLLLI